MINKILGDRYQIIEEVGVGGMAKVYKALDTVLNRYVAVKVLKDEYMDDQEFLKKFAMEAQSAASISHTNIVNVYDVGSSYVDGNKYNYIVMELVEGTTLKEMINQKEALSINDIVDYSIQICNALECAHKSGIIHRDIKPHNMLIDKNNNLKVTDFGIARISSSATLTYTSTVLGTVHYISPEQAKGKFIDEKSDIYSLGVVMYEMATGEVPFDAPNAVGIALKHIQDPLIPPINLRHDLPRNLNDIIVKAMSKNPNDRFRSSTEMKEALLCYKDHGMEYTQLIAPAPVLELEDDEKEEIKEAVYRTPREDEDENEKEEEGIFKKYMLPILLALLVFVGIVYARSISKSNKEDIMVPVPNFVGMTEQEAVAQANNIDLIIQSDGYVTRSDVEAGKVVEQDVAEGTELKKGSIIKIKVSKGEESLSVPNLANMSLESAKRRLSESGLELGEVTKENNDRVAVDQIISQYPEAGSIVDKNSKVDIVISLGEKTEYVKMVNLIGMDISEASNSLKAIGLNVGNIEKRYDENYPNNYVIGQEYKEGEELEKSSSVNLIVSKGPENRDEEENDEDNLENEAYETKNLKIPQPRSLDNYTLTIKDENNNEIVYEDNFSAQDGDPSVTFKAREDANLVIYINGDVYDVD